MRRKLFNFTTLLSLMLCAATVVLWVRSPIPEHGNMCGIGCIKAGNKYLIYSHWARLSRPSVLWERFGIYYSVIPTIRPGMEYTVVANTFSVEVPIWMVVTATSILPIGWLANHTIRRVRRKPPNHCPKCNYNLTGNTSGVCPECGTAVAGKVEV